MGFANWLACSGPFVIETINQAQAFALYGALIAAPFAILLCLVKDLGREFNICRVTALTLMLTHPSWTVSATGGDCGGQQRSMTIWVTGFIVGVGTWGLAKMLSKPGR